MGTCDFESRISAYYDGELSADNARLVQSHLSTCAACQAQLASLQRISAQLAAATSPALSLGFHGRMRARIKAQADQGLLRTAYALVATAASLLVALSLLNQSLGSSPSAATTPQPAAWESIAENPQLAMNTDTDQETAQVQWLIDGLSTDAHE